MSSSAFETLKVVIYENEPDRTIWFDQKPPVVLLSWEKMPGVAMHEVEIFKDAALRKRIFSKMVQDLKLSFLADFFSEGEYYWRINGYSRDSKLVKPGKVKQFLFKTQSGFAYHQDRFPDQQQHGQGRRTYDARFCVFKRGSLWINDTKVLTDFEGPFEYKIKASKGTNRIIYKHVDFDGVDLLLLKTGTG